VSVPPQYRHEAHLRLNLSYRYGIPDLIIDETHVQATLSFGGRPFQCLVPWTSVFGITTNAGEGQVWPEDLPVEVTAGTEETLQPVEPRRPPLAAVESDSPPPAQEEAPKPSAAPQKRHLRLVR
jgi:stringent starvation protein B